MATGKVINVLVVEDSPAVQQLLVHILNSDPEITVIGTATDGDEALRFIQRTKPDVVLMDIYMHGMSGFEATRRIMETDPVPVVICSGSYNPEEVALTFRAIEAGALALVAKPAGPGHPEYAQIAAGLIETVKVMSEVKVVRRWPRQHPVKVPTSNLAPPPQVKSASAISALAIGASTGGPAVLQTILAGMPKTFPAPILIVQHIAAGFLPGLVEWLSQSTGLCISVAEDGMELQPGQVYFAPDNQHMGVASKTKVALSDGPQDHGLRPSVSWLFRTVAEVYGSTAIGVLLTGMGKDGAQELKRLYDRGAITIAQSQATSVVHGMPGEAIRLGAATHVMSPEEIANFLSTIAAVNK